MSSTLTSTPTTTTTTTTRQQLQRLASNQAKWANLQPIEKLNYLRRIKARITQCDVHATYAQAAASCVQMTMGLPLTSMGGRYQSSVQRLMMISNLITTLDSYIHMYAVLAGEQVKPTLQIRQLEGYYEEEESQGGFLAVQVHPLLPTDKAGPLSNVVGEVYLDPEQVSNAKDVVTYDWNLVQQQQQQASKGAGSGAAGVVLGAGNFSLLTVGDLFHLLFHENRVTLVKHHVLQEYQDAILRFVLQPLIVDGYCDLCLDRDFDRTVLYDATLVSHVHMTGGKTTHDTIVWGNSGNNNINNKNNSNYRDKPQLANATMTSELGCVTPWIVAPAVYTNQELHAQAENIAKACFQNTSAACNSPKVVLLVAPQHWPQHDEFVDALLQYFQTHPTPPAWYPGVVQRWQAFKEGCEAGIAKNGKMGSGGGTLREIGCQLDRPMLKPMLLDKPYILPWLVFQTKVDVFNPRDRKAVREIYAFQNEPFAPAITLCTLEVIADDDEYFADAAEKKASKSYYFGKFMRTAVRLCNDYIFGSLSASMSVPDPILNYNKKKKNENDDYQYQQHLAVEDALQMLRYGQITVNAWTAFGYNMKGLPWGAYPGESLDAVESGIGFVNQLCLVCHVLKGVVRFPSTGISNLILPSDETHTAANVNFALGDVLLAPGVVTVVKLLYHLVVDQVSQVLRKWKLWRW